MQHHPVQPVQDEVLEGVIVDPDAAGGGRAPDQLEALLGTVLHRVRATIRSDVARLRAKNPGLSRDQLAELVVRRGSRRVGAASFATGFGGLATTALNVPSVLALQAALVLAVAEVYGELDDPEILQDVTLILAGESAVGALRALGVEVTDEVSKDLVRRSVARSTLRRAARAVSKRVLVRVGERSVGRLVPVAGAAVGLVFDRSWAKVLGERAIRYYGRG